MLNLLTKSHRRIFKALLLLIAIFTPLPVIAESQAPIPNDNLDKLRAAIEMMCADEAPAKSTERTSEKSSESMQSNSHSGIASWYGHPFHGRRTASGAIFDMNKLTAAHPTLPLSCRVLVENPRNGKTVLVTVNDRGPFIKPRVLDLSREAARQLGVLSCGIAYVNYIVLPSPVAHCRDLVKDNSKLRNQTSRAQAGPEVHAKFLAVSNQAGRGLQ